MAFILQGQGSTNGKTEIMKYFQGNRLSTRTVMHGQAYHRSTREDIRGRGSRVGSYRDLCYIGPPHITESSLIPNFWFMNWEIQRHYKYAMCHSLDLILDDELTGIQHHLMFFIKIKMYVLFFPICDILWIRYSMYENTCYHMWCTYVWE